MLSKLPVFQAVNTWCPNFRTLTSHTFYTPKAKQKFLRMDKADIYLVAFAAVAPEEWAIVSMERPAPRNAGEIKLPDACAKFGVRCLMLQDMFREMGESY